MSEPLLCVRLEGPARTLRKFLVDHPCEPQSIVYDRERDPDNAAFHVFVPRAMADTLRQRRDLRVTVIFDPHDAPRPGEPGEDRFRHGRPPEGVGRLVS